MIICDICKEKKYPMDMHNMELCKVCWLESKFKVTTVYKKSRMLSG